MPTATRPPASGPTRYAHHEVQSASTSAGPNDRAGFIDAALTGAPQRPASAMCAGATTRAPDGAASPPPDWHPAKQA